MADTDPRLAALLTPDEEAEDRPDTAEEGRRIAETLAEHRRLDAPSRPATTALDVERLGEAMYNANGRCSGIAGECCAPSTHADAEAIAREYSALGPGGGVPPCDHAAELERLRGALRKIDDLPAGYYRRNGFATPDPWVRQREVRRIARAALEPR